MTKRHRDASGLKALPASGRITGILVVITVALQACGTAQPERSKLSPPKSDSTVLNGSRSHAVNGAIRTPQRRATVVNATTGIASWYGGKFHGRRTASGEIYNKYKLTAAHPSLPFGTRVVVTNLNNGRKVTLTINDRGPFVKGRIIDVSRKAAQRLGFLRDGLARVRVRVVSVAGG